MYRHQLYGLARFGEDLCRFELGLVGDNVVDIPYEIVKSPEGRALKAPRVFVEQGQIRPADISSLAAVDERRKIGVGVEIPDQPVDRQLLCLALIATQGLEEIAAFFEIIVSCVGFKRVEQAAVL